MTLSKRTRSVSKHKSSAGSLPSCYCSEQLSGHPGVELEPSTPSTPKPSKKNFGGILGSLTTLRGSRKTAAVEHHRGFLPGNDTPLQTYGHRGIASGSGPINAGLAMPESRVTPYEAHHYATLSNVKRSMKSSDNRQRSTTVSQSALGPNGGYSTLLSVKAPYQERAKLLKSAGSINSEINSSRVSVNVESNRLKLPAKMMIVRSYNARSEDEISVVAGDGVIVLDCSKNENYLIYKPSSDETPAQEGWVPKKCLDMMYVNRNDSYVSLNAAMSVNSISSFSSSVFDNNSHLSHTLNRRGNSNYQKGLSFSRHLSVTSPSSHWNDPSSLLSANDSSSLSSSFAQLHVFKNDIVSPGPSPEVDKPAPWGTLTRSRDFNLSNYAKIDRSYPGAPGKAEVRMKNKASVMVSWKQPSYRGAHPLTRYTVEMFNNETQVFEFAGETNIRKSEFEVTKLRPGTVCIFRIISHNSIGLFTVGPESEPYTIPMNTPGTRKKKLSPGRKPNKKWGITSLSTSIIDLPAQSPQQTVPTAPKSPNSMKFIDHFDLFYTVQDEIGRGRFSRVKLVQHNTTRNVFAAKFVPKQMLSRNAAEMECQVMHLLQRCPYTCNILQAFESEDNYILVMPSYSKLQMIPFITQSLVDKYTESVVCNFIQQLIAGIFYIHSAGIIHLDIKPENIMVSEETRLIICDFGESVSIFDGSSTNYIAPVYGNFEFKAPEILCKKVVSCATDMWSLGCIGYVLLSGLSPFLDEDPHQTALNIVNADINFNKEYFSAVSFEAQDFIQNLLRASPNQRFSLEICKSHTWLHSHGDYNTQLDPGSSVARLDTERLQAFISRRKNCESDVKYLPEDVEDVCANTWTQKIG